MTMTINGPRSMVGSGSKVRNQDELKSAMASIMVTQAEILKDADYRFEGFTSEMARSLLNCPEIVFKSLKKAYHEGRYSEFEDFLWRKVKTISATGRSEMQRGRK
jgi:hypothetical protein